jgi:hypothetical protein
MLGASRAFAGTSSGSVQAHTPSDCPDRAIRTAPPSWTALPQLERIQQTEARLQTILAQSAPQSAAGVRMSSKDWAAFRRRLTKQWALKYHKIGRWAVVLFLAPPEACHLDLQL